MMESSSGRSSVHAFSLFPTNHVGHQADICDQGTLTKMHSLETFLRRSLWISGCPDSITVRLNDPPKLLLSLDKLLIQYPVKYLHKALATYVRDDRGVTLSANVTPVLKDIAEGASLTQTNKLLELCLMAAINSQKSERYICQIQELRTETQMIMMKIIQGLNWPQESTPELSPSPTGSKRDDSTVLKNGTSTDGDLHYEQRISQLMAQLKTLRNEKYDLENEVTNLSDRLGRSQENNDALKDSLATTEDELEKLRSSEFATGGLKVLKDQIAQQETIITTMEGKLQTAEETIDDLQRSKADLTFKAQKNQRLQDDYDEIKIERDNLSRKANALEKYKQKLQSQPSLEKEIQQAKTDNKRLQERITELESSDKSSPISSKALEEYKAVLPQLERDLFEVNTRKSQLEKMNLALEAREQGMLQQQAKDQEEINDLREKLSSLTGYGSSSSTPKASVHDATFDLMRESSR
jgi:protein HOOK3